MSLKLLCIAPAVVGVGIYRDRAKGSEVDPNAEAVSDARKDYDVDIRFLVEGGKGFREFEEEVIRKCVAMRWTIQVKVEDAGVWGFLQDFQGSELLH